MAEQGQVVEGGDRRLAVGALEPPCAVQHIEHQRLGLRELRLLEEQRREAGLRLQRLGVVHPQVPLVDLHGPAQRIFSAVQQAQFAHRVADGQQQRGLDPRLAGEALINRRQRPREHRPVEHPHRHIRQVGIGQRLGEPGLARLHLTGRQADPLHPRRRGLDQIALQVGPHHRRLQVAELGRLELGDLRGVAPARLGHIALPRRDPGLPEGQAQAPEQRGDRHRRRSNSGAMPSHELAHAVRAARRSRQHRLPTQVPVEIGGEALGRLVAASAVFVEASHHDPVEVAAQRRGPRQSPVRLGTGRGPCGGTRWIDLADHAEHLVPRRGAEPRPLDRRNAREKLVAQDPQAVDVRARVHIHGWALRLLRTHVLGRADELARLGEGFCVPLGAPGRLGDAEVDDPG
jgi:hypothetical protein